MPDCPEQGIDEMNLVSKIHQNISQGISIMANDDQCWIRTKIMAEQLGCSRNTLVRLKKDKYFIEGRHYRRTNPLKPRSDLVWHRGRVLIKMGAL
jgi:hypothetical protein